jgi:hypothetical protein
VGGNGGSPEREAERADRGEQEPLQGSDLQTLSGPCFREESLLV